MLSRKTLKILGYVATGAGLLLNIVSGIIDEQNLHYEVADEVAKEVTKQLADKQKES